MTDTTAEIPPELAARLAHPTVRLSGSIDAAAVASFLNQIFRYWKCRARSSWSYSARAAMPT